MNPDTEPNTWKEIIKILENLAPQYGKHRFQIEGEAMVTRPKWAGELEFLDRAEKPYVAEIESAIAEWTIGKPFRTLEPDQSYWLKSRCVAAMTFAWLHTMPAKIESKKALPEPEGPLEDVIKFLLVKWWNEHGRALHCQWVILDRYDKM